MAPRTWVKMCWALAFALISQFPSMHTATAANFPLEITNIKPAGTGTPPIPETNRIFRAYPGIEYNIRAAVIGGLYPYQFELENAPEGMTIDHRTGEISWPDPQADSGEITITVTDSEAKRVSASWAVTVTTDGFIFLDSKYTGPQTGSIDQPFNSILSMAQNTTQVDETKIVYFREGNYKFELYRVGDTGASRMLLWDRPFTWIGFPNESVNISGGSGVYGRFFSVYMDSLRFSDFTNTGIMFSGGRSYNTIRRTTWENIVADNSTNNNQGFMYATSGGPGYYLTIQDNNISNFTGTAGIGSLYNSHRALIENNYIHGNGGSGLTGINVGMALKDDLDYLTVRGNRVVMENHPIFGTNMNSQLNETTDVEVSFNFFEVKSTEPMLAHSLNGFGYPPYDHSLFNFHYFRNTTIGNISFSYLDGNNCERSGPFKIQNNIIINNNSGNAGHFRTHQYLSYGWDTVDIATSPWLCINDNNNLKGTFSDNIIDFRGELTPKYLSYKGTHGHTLGPKPPSNLKLTFN